MEEADIQTKRALNTTLAYYLGFIALGLVSAVVGPTLNELAAHTHASLGQISLLFSARWLGYMIGSVLGGHLYDRLPGHPLLSVSLLGMAACTALAPVTPLLGVLIFLMLALGSMESILDVGSNTLIGWVHGEKVGPYMNGLHFFFGLGAFFSPIIVAQAVLASGDIRWAYWTLALVMLPAALLAVALPSPPILGETSQQGNSKTAPVLVLLVAVFMFLYAGAEASFGGWIFTYATRLKLADLTRAAYLTSGFWGAFTLGRLASIPVAARFKTKHILIVDLAGCLISLALVVSGARQLVLVWIGVLGTGLFMASIFPTALALAGQRVAMTGSTTRWFFLGAGMGGVFLPWLVGQLFDRGTPQQANSAILGSIGLCVLVYVMMIQGAKEKQV